MLPYSWWWPKKGGGAPKTPTALIKLLKAWFGKRLTKMQVFHVHKYQDETVLDYSTRVEEVAHHLLRMKGVDETMPGYIRNMQKECFCGWISHSTEASGLARKSQDL